MCASASTSFLIARLRTRRNSAAAQPAQQNGNTMLIDLNIQSWRISRLPSGRAITASITFVAILLLSLVIMVGFTTTKTLACACGCSVFDVGGLDLPQEQDHGGRVFFEFWSTDQTQNYVGSSRAPASINLDKQLNDPVVQCWFQLQFQSRLGRDGTHTDRQWHFDHRHWSIRRLLHLIPRISAISKSWASTPAS